MHAGGAGGAALWEVEEAALVSLCMSVCPDCAASFSVLPTEHIISVKIIKGVNST